MSGEKRDYIVVGGGPAGAISAATLAGDGSVLMFSDVKSKSHHCTGLISKMGFERLGVSAGDFVLNKVSGAKLVSPTGRVVEVHGRETKAYVVDRLAFDKHLRDKAVDAGVELIERRVNVGKTLTVGSQDGRYSAGRVVLASGSDYTVHKQLGLDAPDRFLVGSQYEMKVSCDDSMVELYFNAPGFFSWIVPAGDYARVGAATEGNPIPYRDSLVSQLKRDGRLRSGDIYKKTAGLIPVHKPSIRTQYDGLITVGDAAGQVKATTGGGVVYGGVSAKLAGRKDYDRAWKNEIASELRLHLLIRRALNRMSPAGLERLFSVIDESACVLEEGGDMDSAKKTAAALARSPRFLLNLAANFPAILFDLI